MSGAFAYYRLPDEDNYVEIRASEPAIVLNGISEADQTPGFIIAPFSPSSSTAIVKIPTQEVSCHSVSQNDSLADSNFPSDNSSCGNTNCIHILNDESYSIDLKEFTDYQKSFTEFHNAVCKGKFRKLVLSRSKCIELKESVDLKDLFLRACRMYPHMMVMLHHTDISGTWLVATPEPLLEYRNGEYHTVALAGTMNDRTTASEQRPAKVIAAESKPCMNEQIWDAKNREEQRVVEQFITDTVKQLSSEIRKEGPYTSKAGHLLHLKTDIYFKAPERLLGEIVSALHPTPAVCGLPQKEAREFILKHESHNRKYYSGFAGPVGINGGSRLFVCLRCAELVDVTYNCSGNEQSGGKAAYGTVKLYAGGGIMPESKCQSEFEETEHKMQTIKKCLYSVR